MISAAWLEERQGDIAKLDECVERTKALLEPQGISFEVEGFFTEFAWADAQLGELACYADLVLIGGRALADDDLRKVALEGALFQSPAPVLITPKKHAASLQPRRVLLAWDSGLEAGRAVRAAMELLVGADSVHIVMVDPEASAAENGEEPGADIAAYLAKHDAKAVVEVLASGGLATGEVLRRHADDIAADLIVMGAYGHSRLRQRIFGGVTRSMLEETRLPVLLAH
jgi:nucleotide-binding universal stress UspA family protein